MPLFNGNTRTGIKIDGRKYRTSVHINFVSQISVESSTKMENLTFFKLLTVSSVSILAITFLTMLEHFFLLSVTSFTMVLSVKLSLKTFIK